jgi:hypothetical protein
MFRSSVASLFFSYIVLNLLVFIGFERFVGPHLAFSRYFFEYLFLLVSIFLGFEIRRQNEMDYFAVFLGAAIPSGIILILFAFITS